MAATYARARPGAHGARARAGRSLIATTLVLTSIAPVSPRAAWAGEADDGGQASYHRDQRNLMLGLAAWSAASVVAGVVLLAASDRDFPRYFGIQSLAWGAVDGAIAAVALAKIAGDGGPGHSSSSSSYWEGERRSLRTVFWVNAALDVAYVTVGALLWGLGKTDAVRGTGAGVVAQGGFLLAFDTTGALVVSPR